MRNFVCLLAVLVLSYSYFTYAQDDVCTAAGTVETVYYTSAILDQEMRYSVYLPPCYETASQALPVVYLMHGSNSDDKLWLDLGLPPVLDALIQVGELPPMMVVLPFGDWIANENWFTGERTWSNVFLAELMPDVEAQFNAGTERDLRAIGGISRGGFWAFNIALRHPELFSMVGGHSAFFDEGHNPVEYNPLNLAQTASDINTLEIWLDRGADDYAWLNLDRMDALLTQRGIEHTYQVYAEGEHNNAYWASHMADYLRYYGHGLVPAQPGWELFLPAAAFPSTQFSLPIGQLTGLYDGLLDNNLVLGATAAVNLVAKGVPLHSETRLVRDDELEATLWAERDKYTLLPFDQLSLRYRVLNIDDVFPLDLGLENYPFAFQSADSNYQPDKLTRMMFSGVTALARNTRVAIENNGVQWAGEAIQPYVTPVDFFHISNEVSFTARCPASDEPILGGLCARDDQFPLLERLDVDIVELSGNHNNDYGFGGFSRTLDMYHQAGILTVGGGNTVEEARQPAIIDHAGNQIAILSCNWAGPYYAWVGPDQPGAAQCDRDWLETAIPQLAARYDVVIVSSQYIEYDMHGAVDSHRADFRWLADLGADVVLGSQAHMPMMMEFYPSTDSRKVFIHYGLGNLFFDQVTPQKTWFFLDHLLIYDGQLLTTQLYPGIIEDQGRPRLMLPEEREDFLGYILTEISGF